MPRRDRTGPMGRGMRTGRGAGYCGGEDRSGYANAGLGFRCGQGFGRGRGLRGAGTGRGFVAGQNIPWESAEPPAMRSGIDTLSYDRPDPEMEKRMLARQAEDLQIQLDAVRKRLDEIDIAPSSS